ncbi:MAG TPA: hypothetical protein VHY08_24825 [Bacillota bacterium]|nr:hypothetical protein [Bacillota bacterium]
MKLDRTFRGLIAGALAGVAMNVWNLTDYYFFHISNLRLLDWVAVLTSGAKSQSFGQATTDLLVQIIWDGSLGIIFAHLLLKITTQGLLVKSILYGTILWFFFRSVAILFKITPLIAGQTFPGRLSNLLGAVLWGLLLGATLKRFDKIPEK